jgi:hypothetical protein
MKAAAARVALARAGSCSEHGAVYQEEADCAYVDMDTLWTTAVRGGHVFEAVLWFPPCNVVLCRKVTTGKQ